MTNEFDKFKRFITESTVEDEISSYGNWEETDTKFNLDSMVYGEQLGYELTFIDNDGTEQVTKSIRTGTRSIRPIKVQFKTENGILFYRVLATLDKEKFLVN